MNRYFKLLNEKLENRFVSPTISEKFQGADPEDTLDLVEDEGYMPLREDSDDIENNQELPPEDDIAPLDLQPITKDDLTKGSKLIITDKEWEVWKPETIEGLINLSSGTTWLAKKWWDKKDYSVSSSSWVYQNFANTYFIVNKNNISKRYLFIRGWGGMYTPSKSQYSLATWILNKEFKKFRKWFADQNFQIVSKRLKADISAEIIKKSGGVYTYPDDGVINWKRKNEITKVIVKQGTTKILSRAFAWLGGLTEIDIPDSVTYIGPYAFGGTEKLEKIKLPKSLTTISNNAFYGSGIKELILPDGVKTIGYASFHDCENLKTLFIPKSVKILNDNIFGNNEFSGTVYCEASEKPSGWNEEWNLTEYPNKYGYETRYENGQTMRTPTRINMDPKRANVVWGASKPTVSENLIENNPTDKKDEPELEPVDIVQVKIKEPLVYSDDKWEVYESTRYDIYKKYDHLFNQSNDYDEDNFYMEKPLYFYIIEKNGKNKFLLSTQEPRGPFMTKQEARKKLILPKNKEEHDYESFRGGSINIDKVAIEIPFTLGLTQWFINKLPSLKDTGMLERVKASLKTSKETGGILIYPEQKNLINTDAKKSTAQKIIKKITITEGVKIIPDKEFDNFTLVENVVFPKSLVKLGKYSFRGTQIKNIILPENLIYIGEQTFSGRVWSNNYRNNNNKVFIPKSVMFIGEDAFDENSKISCEATGLPEFWDQDWYGGKLTSVVWGASKPTITEDMELPSFEPVDVKEEVLFDKGELKLTKLSNVNALTQYFDVATYNQLLHDLTDGTIKNPLDFTDDVFKNMNYILYLISHKTYGNLLVIKEKENKNGTMYMNKNEAFFMDGEGFADFEDIAAKFFSQQSKDDIERLAELGIFVDKYRCRECETDTKWKDVTWITPNYGLCDDCFSNKGSDEIEEIERTQGLIE